MALLRHVVESLVRYYSWCFTSRSLVSSQSIPTRELCRARSATMINGACGTGNECLTKGSCI